VEVAVAAGSIPPDWYDDDRTLVTLMHVLKTRNDEAAKKRRR
jgi:hypothetical protein